METPPAQAAPSAPTVHALNAEPPEPADDGADDEPAIDPAAVKAPEQGKDHRWTDPETGIKLDLRRRDHRRMKRALEERYAFAQRAMQASQPAPREQEPPQAPRPQARQAAQPDPNDPEPVLEQFANEADPYAAHTRALARWEARQEFKEQQASHSRVERERQTSERIVQAQQAYDAELPQVRERYPDFDDAHQDVLDTLSRVPQQARAGVVQRLLTSPIRHDLTHYLGSHPDDMQALVTARSASEQAFILGAIETRVRALVNQRSRVPAPVNPPAAPMEPVHGGGTPTTYNPATANLAQFRRKHGVRGGRAVSA